MIQPEYIEPQDIEKRSMEIIEEELIGRSFEADNAPVIKRVIHTTADFDFADTLRFSRAAVLMIRRSLREGALVITDTQMSMAGINKCRLKALGGTVHCFMSDDDVAREARERGVTRAAVSMERAAALDGEKLFAIGNAPTALFALDELIKKGLRPAAVIAVPVGFVNVVQSKELIVDTCEREDIPYIAAMGRKGGSTVAAAIVNALLYGI